jgi:predicted RNase H-like nuclease (RuvC/YqgF family)
VELESIATSSSVDMKPFEADVADAEEELVKLTDTVNRLKEEVSNCSPEMEGIRRKLDEANLRNQKILQDSAYILFIGPLLLFPPRF